MTVFNHPVFLQTTSATHLYIQRSIISFDARLGLCPAIRPQHRSHPKQGSTSRTVRRLTTPRTTAQSSRLDQIPKVVLEGHRQKGFQAQTDANAAANNLEANFGVGVI